MKKMLLAGILSSFWHKSTQVTLDVYNYIFEDTYDSNEMNALNLLDEIPDKISNWHIVNNNEWIDNILPTLLTFKHSHKKINPVISTFNDD